MAYQRRLLLINRPFQLRFAFYVVSWMIALSVTYPLIIYELFEMLGRILIQVSSDPAIGQQILDKRQEVVLLLILLQIAVMSVMFLVSIFLSHRIAGPIYKLMKSMEEARAGKLEGPIFFRKNDHFKELADQFNALHEQWNQTLVEKDQKLKQAAASLENVLKSQPSIETRAQIDETLKALKA
jgi:methyl-accepting chemotaxis protein